MTQHKQLEHSQSYTEAFEISELQSALFGETTKSVANDTM